MSNFKTPGVYVQEVSTIPASVAPVETAIPVFIGYTETAETANGENLTDTPWRITSLLEYEQIFGGADTVSITANVNGSDSVMSVETTTGTNHNMYESLQMFYANGGGPCYIVSVGSYGSIDRTRLSAGLVAAGKEDEPTIIVFPEAIGALGDSDYAALLDEALMQCNDLGDRVALADVKEQGGSVADDAKDFRDDYLTTAGVDFLKYGAAYYPHLKTVLNPSYDDSDVTISGGSYDGETLDALLDEGTGTDTTIDLELYNAIRASIASNLRVTLPPSPIMAGIYARVDSNRGVWKAPANESISSIIEPTIKVTTDEQEGLNVDTSGKSINAIRTFTGKGTLVWGARTLAGNDNEWRYVPVRRLFNFAEESIAKATEFVVFEPNDSGTWSRVSTSIRNFLNNLWRDGALAGATPDEAYFVRVGLGQTMTAQDILEGRMIVEIGMAAVRPAEFIILRFSHKLQES